MIQLKIFGTLAAHIRSPKTVLSLRCTTHPPHHAGLLEEKSTRYPSEVHLKTGEFYMRLPAPNDNIIITPPRPSDTDAIVAIMNDERVALKFSFPPYPYLREHAVAHLEADEERHRDAREEGGLFSECPVQSIREVRDNGEEIYIGEARLVRSKYYNIRDEEEAKRLTQTNFERPIGDPDILWTFSGKRPAKLLSSLSS